MDAADLTGEAGEWRVIVIRRPLPVIQRLNLMGALFDEMYQTYYPIEQVADQIIQLVYS